MAPRTPKRQRRIAPPRSSDSPERVGEPVAPVAVEPGGQESVTGHFEAFVGQLPHPDHYAAYEQTLGGAADRILALTERQSAHRQTQEALELRAHIDARARGQWFAFIVALTSLGLGAYLAAAGMSTIGGVIVTFGLAELGLTIYLKVRRILNPEDDRGSPPAPPKPPPRRPGDTR